MNEDWHHIAVSHKDGKTAVYVDGRRYDRVSWLRRVGRRLRDLVGNLRPSS